MVTDLRDLLAQEWTLVQLALLIGALGAGHLLARLAHPALSRQARRIKLSPGLLRVIAALLKRLRWLFGAVVLGVILVVLRETTWPSRSYLLGIAFSLMSAWLVIGVLSRVIRSRAAAKLVAWAGWIVAGLAILGLLDDSAALLDGLAIQMGSLRLSLLQVLQGFVLVIGLVWLATGLGNFLDARLQTIEDLTPSLRVLLGKLVKIALVAAAFLLALSVSGIDLTALTIFSGAIGVGLGFGLQKVVSNFISGVIILSDRSIKPGDTISLGETFGWIRELRARFVSVVTRDGREYLIPNEDFITQRVINWSFTDSLVRLDVSFGVSYASDPHRVSALAREACAAVPRVFARRAPVCWITAFGDSSIQFVLRFWIADPQAGLTNVRGQVLLALWDAFKTEGIEFPFPHREIFLRNESPHWAPTNTHPPSREPPMRGEGAPAADGTDDAR